MNRSKVNLLLGAVLGILIAINLGYRPDARRPNFEFFPDMAHSPAFAAFSANPVFTDGKTLRSPVPGTIARGHMPLHFTATPEDAARAGEELHNPFNDKTPGALERGRFIFFNFCTPCHGTSARGDGPVTQRGVPAPPSFYADHARGLKDGQIFHILTTGQGNMKPYAAQLSREDRWKVILYIRSLQKSKKMP